MFSLFIAPALKIFQGYLENLSFDLYKKLLGARMIYKDKNRKTQITTLCNK